MVNTMIIGKVISLNGDKVSIEVYNKKSLNCQIFENAQGNTTDISKYYSQPIGQLTLRFFSLAYILATPQVGDQVLAIVPQSSIEGFFNEKAKSYGGDYPLAEALVIPIKTGYTQNSKLTINPNSDTITDVDINSKNLNIKSSAKTDIESNELNINSTSTQIAANKFDITGNGGAVFVNMIIMLKAIGLVQVSGSTIDSLSGGAITTFTTYLELFA
jgi:hypothetical protein